MLRIARWFAAAMAPALVCALALTHLARVEPSPTHPPATRPAPPLNTPPPLPDLEASEPSSEIPTLSEASRVEIEKREHALATELSKMWTRNPNELVTVIDGAARNAPSSPSVTLLLAIAHAETNGKILDVSEAGAVGLAQATPIAIRQENFSGKMFVTADYLVGSRAYIMKKPLGDADTIASLIVARDDTRMRKRAKGLLASAMSLRREGVDELDLLGIFASEHYPESIEKADELNLRALRRLKHLLDSGSRSQIREFRDRTRRQYRLLKHTQVESWAQYQHDLATERDRMLEEQFGEPAASIKKNRPYEAGEYLGESLDLRFSPVKMSAFLVRHLERKSEEARKLASSRHNVEEMTAALYNGGPQNVKRMLAGLIASLPETEHYMKKVPATRRRLDRSIEIAGAQLEALRERGLR
jgi:hypothetical protein